MGGKTKLSKQTLDLAVRPETTYQNRKGLEEMKGQGKSPHLEAPGERRRSSR
jgi:hypothetical protein